MFFFSCVGTEDPPAAKMPATLVVFLAERINLCKTCIICMPSCLWFQKEPFASFLCNRFLKNHTKTHISFFSIKLQAYRYVFVSFNKYLRLIFFTEHLLSQASFSCGSARIVWFQLEKIIKQNAYVFTLVTQRLLYITYREF